MPDRMKPGTRQFNDRQRRHRHNGYMGCVVMMQTQLRAMIESDTTTHTTKAYARQMLAQSDYLKKSIKERVDV